MLRGYSADGSRRRHGYSVDAPGRYLGQPDTDGTRCLAVGVLGSALDTNERSAEALPVLEAFLALNRRLWPHAEHAILNAQASLAVCLQNLGRCDEALVLRREIYANYVAMFGVSHEHTIVSGSNLAMSTKPHEAKTLVRDQLLPAARQSLGPDHNLTLGLGEILVAALANNPDCTRDDLRLN